MSPPPGVGVCGPCLLYLWTQLLTAPTPAGSHSVCALVSGLFHSAHSVLILTSPTCTHVHSLISYSCALKPFRTLNNLSSPTVWCPGSLKLPRVGLDFQRWPYICLSAPPCGLDSAAFCCPPCPCTPLPVSLMSFLGALPVLLPTDGGARA